MKEYLDCKGHSDINLMSTTSKINLNLICESDFSGLLFQGSCIPLLSWLSWYFANILRSVYNKTARANNLIIVLSYTLW